MTATSFPSNTGWLYSVAASNVWGFPGFDGYANPQPYGSAVNYVATVAHTSSSTNEPEIGSSWTSDWEPASLADMRLATAAGSTIEGVDR